MYDNIGDEVINALLLREILKRQSLTAFTYGVPSWYKQNLIKALLPYASRLKCVESPWRFLALMLVQGFQQERCWFFVSCGHIMPRNKTLAKDILFAGLQYMPSMRMAMVGASMACTTRSHSSLLRIAQRRGDGISVRDNTSQKLLLQRNVVVPVVPDLAFLLPCQTSGHKTDLVISMRPVPPTYCTKTLQLLVLAVESAKRKGLNCTIIWHHPIDSEFCTWLSLRLGVSIEHPMPTKIDRFEKVCAIYDRAKIIISNRLHVLLIGASRGAKPISLLYPGELKVRSLMADIGLGSCILDINSDKQYVDNLISGDLDAGFYRDVVASQRHRIVKYFDRILGPALPS